MVRPGSGRFEVGFWVGFRVGLRARDFPTEGVLSRTPLIIRTVNQRAADRSIEPSVPADPGLQQGSERFLSTVHPRPVF